MTDQARRLTVWTLLALGAIFTILASGALYAWIKPKPENVLEHQEGPIIERLDEILEILKEMRAKNELPGTETRHRTG